MATIRNLDPKQHYVLELSYTNGRAIQLGPYLGDKIQQMRNRLVNALNGTGGSSSYHFVDDENHVDMILVASHIAAITTMKVIRQDSEATKIITGDRVNDEMKNTLLQ